ncbi:MAG: alpha/beta hydrolase [Omnitrophica WOR_2 bacterium]
MRMVRSSQRVLVIFGIFISFFIAACVSPQAVTPAALISTIPLSSCRLTAPGIQTSLQAKCGSLPVYENRLAKSGRQIPIHVAVIKAISRNYSPDPLFYIAGGPGEASTESYVIFHTAFSLINQKRDIVLVDQRGTGQSNPLQCTFSREGSDGANNPDQAANELLNCRNQLSANADLRYYTTSIAMDDLDEIRQALGYDQINLYGVSYGTRAALAYMRQYPGHVRSVILDGVAPPNWSLGSDSSVNAQRSLDSMFRRCNSEPACKAAYPDLNHEFQSLLQSLQNQPVKVTINDPLSGELQDILVNANYLANTIFSMSYASESATLIPLLIHSSYIRKDFNLVASQGLANSEATQGQINQGMRFSVLCAEDVPFFRPSDSEQAGYLGNSFVKDLQNTCEVWPRGGIPPDFKKPVESTTPVLLISGQDDPVTPPSNGEMAAQTLSNHLHLVVPGQGHMNIFRGCLPRIGSSFYESGSVANLDTACIKEILPMPFFINFSGPTP